MWDNPPVAESPEAPGAAIRGGWFDPSATSKIHAQGINQDG